MEEGRERDSQRWPDEPQERDLRQTFGARTAADPPYRPPQISQPYIPPPPPPTRQPPAYTEVVEESGLTGIRIVAKIVDVVAMLAIMQLLLVPFNVFPNLVPGFPIDQEEFQRETEEAETVGELMDIMMEVMAPFLVLLIIFYLVLMLAYFFVGEYMTKQTFGKKAFGLRVIDMTNGRMTAAQAFTRAALTALSIMFYFWVVDILVMLMRRDGKSVIDLIVGTQVIRVKKIYHMPRY